MGQSDKLAHDKLDILAAGQSSNSPTSVFGQVLVVQPSSAFEDSFVHTKLLHGIIERSTLSGSVTLSDQMVHVSTGVTLNATASIRDEKFLRYNPGKGSGWKGTPLFTAGVANSLQYAGLATDEAAFIIGYDGTKFGIARQTAGRLEIQALQITTKSTTAENITVTLDGVAFSVPVTDQTAGTASHTAAEIAEFNAYPGWVCTAVDDTIFFVKTTTGITTGAYSLTGATTAVGAFTQNQAGVATVYDWYYMDQNEAQKWNFGDNSSLNFTLDPTKGNIYRITFGYLGFDGILFEVKSPLTKKFVPIHYYDYLNTNTIPSTQDPSLRGVIAVESLGSTTDISISLGSMAGDIQGEVELLGQEFGHSSSQSTLNTGASTWQNVLSIRANLTFGADDNHKVNRGNVKLTSAALTLVGGAKPGEMALFKNATISGTANIWEEEHEDSMVSYNTSLVNISGGRKVRPRPVNNSHTTEIDMQDANQYLEAGETITLAVRIPLGGASPDGVASIDWIEDN